MDYSDALMEIIRTYIEKSKSIINAREQPDENSQAKTELRIEAYKDYIAYALSIGIVLREVAVDNLLGIQRVLTQPIMSFAPFVLLRGLIEMSAMSIWFHSIGINEIERTKRILTYRNYALQEELKHAHCVNDQELSRKILEKLQKLEEKASLIFVEAKRNIKNEIIGYGISMPTKTQIIKECLDAEAYYRYFSAISHGQPWAMIQSSFKEQKSKVMVFEDVQGSIMEKNISPISYFFLCQKSIEFLTKAEIEQFKYYGWDEKPLVHLELEMRLLFRKVNKTYKVF